MQKTVFGILIIVFVFSLWGCGANQSAESRGDNTPAAVRSTTRGHDLFQQRCIACHGLNGNYRNNNAADLSISKIDSLSIVTTIINGKGAMPMFDHVLADSDLAELELYVKTLRK